MSSQEHDASSSQRSNADNDGDRPLNGAAADGSAAGSSRPAPAAAGQQQQQGPPQQPPQGPQDVFGMLANFIPQAMEGIVNQMMGGAGAGGGARQGEQAAADAAAPNAQQQQQDPPHVIAGVDRVLEMMRQQQGLWQNMGQMIDRAPEERQRRAAETRQQANGNDPMAAMLATLEGALDNWHQGYQAQQQMQQDLPNLRPAYMAAAPAAAEAAGGPAPPAAAPAPFNFANLITAAASGLAGGAAGAGAGAGQSFQERLAAAAQRGQAAGAAAGAAAGVAAGAAPPPPPRQQPQVVINLPQFGGARIEFVGMPGNWDDMLAQLRAGFDPNAASGSRIPEEHLALLPNSSVTQKHVDDGRQCFICMDTFTQVGEPVSQLTCGHIFHTKDCIVKWLQRNTTCPVCRAEVVSRNWMHDAIELD